MNLYLDIETIPGQDPAIRAAIAAEIEAVKAETRAPANYKDPVKIAEYIEAKRAELDAQAEERWRNTALDGARGEIVCIAWAIDDEPVRGVVRDLRAGGGEDTVLRDFFGRLDECLNPPGARHRPRFIGHNILGFDLRFIFQRAVILGVKPPCILPHDARGNGELVYDTMLAWAGWGNRVALDEVCRALGVGGKGSEFADGQAVDGSMVWDLVKAGEIERVATYCCGDVERVRRIYRRMNFLTEAA